MSARFPQVIYKQSFVCFFFKCTALNLLTDNRLVDLELAAIWLGKIVREPEQSQGLTAEHFFFFSSYTHK